MAFGIFKRVYRVGFSEYSSGDLEVNVLGDTAKLRDQMSTALRSKLYNKKAGLFRWFHSGMEFSLINYPGNEESRPLYVPTLL